MIIAHQFGFGMREVVDGDNPPDMQNDVDFSSMDMIDQVSPSKKHGHAQLSMSFLLSFFGTFEVWLNFPDRETRQKRSRAGRTRENVARERCM